MVVAELAEALPQEIQVNLAHPDNPEKRSEESPTRLLIAVENSVQALNPASQTRNAPNGS